MSELENLKLATIHKLSNGQAGGEFDHELRRVLEDIRDRPGEGGARTVTFKVKIKPKASQRMDVDACSLDWSVTSALPNIKSEGIHLEVSSDNTARFFDHGQEETPLEREVNSAKVQPVPGNGTDEK